MLKGYDVKSIYNIVKAVYDGEAFIPLRAWRSKGAQGALCG